MKIGKIDTKRKIFLCTLVFLLILVSSAQVYAASTRISLNKTKVSITTGASVTLKAIVSGKSGKVYWSTSNNRIARVNSNGKVTGIKAGTAKITAKAGGKKAVCTVIVKNKNVKLKDPVIYNWKAKYGWQMMPPADGVKYIITWKKVAGASGYQVKADVKEMGNWYSSYITTKKYSYSTQGSTIEKVKAKVRAYKIVNGKKQYGPWSKTKVAGYEY